MGHPSESGLQPCPPADPEDHEPPAPRFSPIKHHRESSRLKAHFDSGPEAAGRSKELADRYLADRFRPTADLLGDATAQLDRATEFQLLDQQRIVDEVSKDVIEAMAPRRTLFAGAGRPSEREDRKGQVVIVEGVTRDGQNGGRRGAT